LLEREERPGPADTGLNLVEAEKRRERSCSRHELRVKRNHASLAENRLEQNQTDVTVCRSLERFDVVGGNKAHAGYQGLERTPLRGLAGRR
jgi:hypothetical protein